MDIVDIINPVAVFGTVYFISQAAQSEQVACFEQGYPFLPVEPVPGCQAAGDFFETRI